MFFFFLVHFFSENAVPLEQITLKGIGFILKHSFMSLYLSCIMKFVINEQMGLQLLREKVIILYQRYIICIRALKMKVPSTSTTLLVYIFPSVLTCFCFFDIHTYTSISKFVWDFFPIWNLKMIKCVFKPLRYHSLVCLQRFWSPESE